MFNTTISNFNLTRNYSQFDWNKTRNLETFSNLESVLIPITFSMIFLFGIIGNGVLLSYMVRRRRMTSPHNIYVINLAVGDLLMLTVSMPFMSTIFTFETWPYGDIVCKLSEFFHTLCCSVTVCMLTALSIERYIIASGRCSEHRNSMAIIAVFVIWVYSFMFAIPDLVSANLYEDPGYEVCVLYRHSWGEAYAKTMTIQKLIFLFIVPVMTSFLCYTATLIRLLQVSSNSSTVQIDTAREDGKKVHLIILIFILMIVFIFSWLPRRIYLMWYYFDPSPYDNFWHLMKLTGFCLMYANSAFNPLVFFVLDRDFRKFSISCCHEYRTQQYSPVDSANAKNGQTMMLTGLTPIDEIGSMV